MALAFASCEAETRTLKSRNHRGMLHFSEKKIHFLSNMYVFEGYLTPRQTHEWPISDKDLDPGKAEAH